ncbi:hypothetical protein D3C86_1711560 [compost metagenome]
MRKQDGNPPFFPENEEGKHDIHDHPHRSQVMCCVKPQKCTGNNKQCQNGTNCSYQTVIFRKIHNDQPDNTHSHSKEIGSCTEMFIRQVHNRHNGHQSRKKVK